MTLELEEITEAEALKQVVCYETEFLVYSSIWGFIVVTKFSEDAGFRWTNGDTFISPDRFWVLPRLLAPKSERA